MNEVLRFQYLTNMNDVNSVVAYRDILKKIDFSKSIDYLLPIINEIVSKDFNGLHLYSFFTAKEDWKFLGGNLTLEIFPKYGQIDLEKTRKNLKRIIIYHDDKSFEKNKISIEDVSFFSEKIKKLNEDTFSGELKRINIYEKNIC